jgi:hypothetical protein
MIHAFGTDWVPQDYLNRMTRRAPRLIVRSYPIAGPRSSRRKYTTLKTTTTVTIVMKVNEIIFLPRFLSSNIENYIIKEHFVSSARGYLL